MIVFVLLVFVAPPRAAFAQRGSPDSGDTVASVIDAIAPVVH